MNGATSLGSISNTNLVNYLDDNNYGRRVDLNIFPSSIKGSNWGTPYVDDTTSTGMCRLLL